MNYMLDTNACVCILRGKPERVRKQAETAVGRGSALLLSTIVVHELWYGIYQSSRVDENLKRLRAFFAWGFETLPFEVEDALAAAKIRALLETKGQRIGAYDTLIAGQCLRNELALVTNNLSEFSRVPTLHCVDWTT